MHNLLARLRPILSHIENDLEENGSRPIPIKELVGLFQKYTSKEIECVPSRLGGLLQGTHLSFPEKNKILIMHEFCDSGFDRACASCQAERFAIAKELVHIIDDDNEKTPPTAARADLLERLVTNDFTGKPMNAEFMAELGALELLAPYIVRKGCRGDRRDIEAARTQDYSFFSALFSIPEAWAAVAFSDNYWNYIIESRRVSGCTR